MFAKYPYIPEEHKATLRSVIAQHEIVTEALLARLYFVAHKLFTEGVHKEPGTILHFIDGGPSGRVTGATDDKTGIYLQLSGPTTHAPMLTVGQKWAIQASAPGLSQVATKHW